MVLLDDADEVVVGIGVMDKQKTGKQSASQTDN